MTPDEIKIALMRHRAWLNRQAGGACADLRGADLRGAILTCADLRGADLRGAILTNADLTGAILTNADLTGADLRGANLTDAILIGVNLTDAILTWLVPIVPSLDASILSAIEGPAAVGVLNMTTWHETDACGTTHCRAGWAIYIAGEAGRALEKRLGSATAGALIYHASTGRVPNFYADNKEALADIRRCASDDQKSPTT